ncbi:hypothetical protein [Thermus sp.]|uniref:DUF7718 family protein n=1 Tax=Thermus sp. TaxID=275 RepID=UPI0025EC7593|nr:hypothetical protein [Thermus sp.]MCS6867799.1 hypothetical protein [Thermus sp.]
MGPERHEEYLEDFGPVRLRTTFRRQGGRLGDWGVQLEWYDPEERAWVWVARYDTAGGRPHRDRNRIAAHEPVPLPQDPAQALKAAQMDLRTRLEEYIEAYRAAKAQGRQGW